MLSRLKQLRQEHGLSQRALADQLGISQQSINKYENHNIEPDIEMLCQIADVFDVSIDYLVERTNQPQTVSVPPEMVKAGALQQLSVSECCLVNDYRRLSEKERESIELIMQNYMVHKK